MLSKATPQPKPKKDPRRRARTHEAKLRKLRNAVWAREAGDWGDWVFCYACRRTIFRSSVKDAAHGEVHHIKPRSTSPEAKYDPNNCVLLCRLCHLAVTEHRIEVTL